MGEGCWVIVPVKSLEGAKSRLSPVLSASQRYRLARELLKRTFRLLQLALEKKMIAGFVVVSSDREALALTEKYKGQALPEKEETGSNVSQLNPALGQAARWCRETQGARALLLIPTDLPLLEEADLRELLSYLKDDQNSTLAVIAPDRREEGTNALLLRPPELLDYSYYFGEKSFVYHLTALGGIPGVELKLCRRNGLAFDLDRPEDLEALPEALKHSLFGG